MGQAITKVQAEKFLKYQSIFGCKGDESVHTTLTNSIGHDPVQVPRDASKHFGLCEYSNTYKNVAKPHHDATNRAAYFGQLVLIDDLGPFPEKCIVTGAKYARKFTDEATGWWAIYPVVDFNSAETVAIVKQYMGDHAHLLPEGKTYTTMRTDGGSVLRSANACATSSTPSSSRRKRPCPGSPSRWDRTSLPGASWSVLAMPCGRARAMQGSRAAQATPYSLSCTLPTCITTCTLGRGVGTLALSSRPQAGSQILRRSTSSAPPPTRASRRRSGRTSSAQTASRGAIHRAGARLQRRQDPD